MFRFEENVHSMLQEQTNTTPKPNFSVRIGKNIASCSKNPQFLLVIFVLCVLCQDAPSDALFVVECFIWLNTVNTSCFLVVHLFIASPIFANTKHHDEQSDPIQEILRFLLAACRLRLVQATPFPILRL